MPRHRAGLLFREFKPSLQKSCENIKLTFHQMLYLRNLHFLSMCLSLCVNLRSSEFQAVINIFYYIPQSQTGASKEMVTVGNQRAAQVRNPISNPGACSDHPLPRMLLLRLLSYTLHCRADPGSVPSPDPSTSQQRRQRSLPSSKWIS